MTSQEQRDFLQGVWMSDGNREKGQDKDLHTPNLKLIKDIQILMAGVGFDGTICKTTEGWKLRVSEKRFNAKPVRRYPARLLAKAVSEVTMKNYDDPNQYITDRRNHKSGNDVTQFVAERIIEKNCNDPNYQTYRFDRVSKIELLDRQEDTYTMSVDDPLHQFVADGVVQKNTAFHWLLWSMVRVVKWLGKHRMKTKVIGQIHDSIVFDFHPAEIQDVLSFTHKTMTEDLPKAFTWINVPIECEAEVAPVGKSWFAKEVWPEENGTWKPKGK